MMIFLGIAIFGFCLWAVFSRHFCDGIVAKHLLAFSAISGALTVLDPDNLDAAFSATLLLISAMIYWMVKHRKLVAQHLHATFH